MLRRGRMLVEQLDETEIGRHMLLVRHHSGVNKQYPKC